ncbi:MAG: hypothetical protein ABS949_11640 [Solibacillus sp.]
MERITLEQKLDAIFRYENGEEILTSITKSLNLTTTEMLKKSNTDHLFTLLSAELFFCADFI